MTQREQLFLERTGDAVRAPLLGLQTLNNLRQQQAASLAYFDVFSLCAALTIGLVVLVLLLKRSVAENGEHIGAE